MDADKNGPKDISFRTDIQALRGLAILLVLFHHAGLTGLQAGYLGVDIFFVISGFLITKIVSKDVQAGSFMFSGFYFRRAKRLLPAAYATFLFTAIFSVFFLNNIEQLDFAKQLLGALTFTGNIALWLQAGYFEGPAKLKPLLHVWSLAIEEQYYLFLPTALVFVPRRFWITGTTLALGVSLGLTLLWASSKPGAAFYLLPTRGWELAIGSLGALVWSDQRGMTWPSRLFWPALLTLAAVPIIPTGAPHPGLDALLVCLATLVLILARHPILNEGSIPRLFATVGDFSYSLYLVHWPLFAFANNAYVSEVPLEIRAGLVVAAIVIGYLQYRLIELPFWRSRIKFSGRLLGASIAASVALGLVALEMLRVDSSLNNYAQIRRVNHGFGLDCEFVDDFTPIAACRDSDNPKILVWGDSFAMHLVPGLTATTDLGVIQATRSVCGPFVGVSPMDSGDYQRPWAENCLRFNQSVLDYLAATPSVEIVVLSSPFLRYLDGPGSLPGAPILKMQNGIIVETRASTSGAVAVMAETVAKIRLLGKRVVVVAPPPSADFNIGGCLERKASGKMILGARPDCQIPVSKYHRRKAGLLQFLSKLPQEAHVNVVRFDESLCSDTLCATELAGQPIYRDEGHFSYAGSQLIAKRMMLVNRLLKSAR